MRALPKSIAAALATAVGLTSGACGQEPPSRAPGWTGATAPEEVIEARRVLMQETERQMKAIDQYTLGGPAEPAALKASAVTIEALLLALPHLFPPTTNRFDPTTREPPTIALPAVWENFAAFEQMGVAAEEAAAQLIGAENEAQLRDAARTLRATCDACHAAFTKPYVPPKVTDEDLNFDFEEFLPK
jgi:cytochrome c556